MAADLPNDLSVDTEVFVNDPVSQSDDLRPFDAGCVLLCLVRQSSGRLADDLEISDYCIDGLLVCKEGFLPHTLDIFRDAAE